MKPENLHGTWSLVSFEIENHEGIRNPWGKDTHGLLIYAPSGHMSVSINKAIENDPEQTEAENLFDSILFYSGTYQMEGELIRHQVTQASNPARIGKEMLRYATLDGETLELATPKESFGRGILRWKRVIS
jgi:hypothetical protein